MRKCVFAFLCVHFTLVLSCDYFKWNPLTSSKKNHIAALILARGGSKGIKLKNIARIGNSTLLKISIKALKEVNGLTSIWVSTDHSRIAAEANIDNVNIHWRTRESATDSATSIIAVQEFVKIHPYVDIVCLVQCTSPFIKAIYLQKAINWINNQVECVFSVTRSYKLRWQEVGDKLVPLNFNLSQRPRRQNFRGELVENGMFYISTSKLIKNGRFQSERYAVV